MHVATPYPIAKVTAGALAGALVVIVTWLLDAYAGVSMPPQVQDALIVLISALIAYLTPIQPGEIVAD